MSTPRRTNPQGLRRAAAFISSTNADLGVHRSAAAAALRELGVEVRLFEDFEAAPRPPVLESRKIIASCDLFVCLLAFRYGYVPTEGNPERRSFVELELRTAWELGKPTLVFLLDERAPWPPQHIDDGDARERLRTLRHEVIKRVTIATFASVDELAAKVATAARKWLEEFQRDDPPDKLRPFAGPPWPLPPDDALELAFRLVVDRKAEPVLLRHMDAALLNDAAELWAKENANVSSQPHLDALHSLRKTQADLAPNALWMAWMRATREHLLEAHAPARETAHPAAGERLP